MGLAAQASGFSQASTYPASSCYLSASRPKWILFIGLAPQVKVLT